MNFSLEYDGDIVAAHTVYLVPQEFGIALDARFKERNQAKKEMSRLQKYLETDFGSALKKSFSIYRWREDNVWFTLKTKTDEYEFSTERTGEFSAKVVWVGRK